MEETCEKTLSIKILAEMTMKFFLPLLVFRPCLVCRAAISLGDTNKV